MTKKGVLRGGKYLKEHQVNSPLRGEGGTKKQKEKTFEKTKRKDTTKDHHYGNNFKKCSTGDFKKKEKGGQPRAQKSSSRKGPEEK